MAETEAPSGGLSTDIVAHRGTYFRNTRILVTGMILVMGAYFLYDGFVGYPKYNEKFAQSKFEDQMTMEKPHQDRDIQIQKYLGFSLLPLGIVLGIWFFYGSRGAYRLSGDIVSIPGHPPVPLQAVRDIDKTKWDRKGIAYVDYELSDGTLGSFRLDDFVYERKPTDEILARIESVWKPADEVHEAEVSGAE